MSRQRRRAPRSLFHATPLPSEVVLLLLRSGDDVTIGGVYASQPEAEAAEGRVVGRHEYKYLRLRVGADQFPTVT